MPPSVSGPAHEWVVPTENFDADIEMRGRLYTENEVGRAATIRAGRTGGGVAPELEWLDRSILGPVV